ncbi:MAG TPA: winged helix-turn-helix domain-containing protein [Candidatus Eisenbacteria bacterium]|nr:winged helix-turn-helix domain-containing protein [Candidatus Eisenbacteria bacterium]
MLKPITEKTFEAMCKQWVDIINHERDHGLFIWAPLEAPSLRIRQFFADKELQVKLFGKKEIPALIEVNGEEIENFSFEDLERQVNFALEGTTDTTFSLEKVLSQRKQKLALFIIGIDSLLKNQRFELMKHLNTLAERYENVSFLFFVRFDVMEIPLFNSYQIPHLLSETFYQKVFSEKDCMHFLHHMEQSWNIKVNKKLSNDIAKNFQGHLFLIKAAIRLARDNPEISIEEILDSPALIRRGLGVFEGLTAKDQETVLSLLHNKIPSSISEYLRKTGLVQNNMLGIPYWYRIKNDIFRLKNHDNSIHHQLELQFTSLERETFDIFMETKTIVTREKLAKTIWRNEWMERYSNWAIDQLIHRIREKIKKAGAPYEIVTKKGEGFYLKEIKK